MKGCDGYAIEETVENDEMHKTNEVQSILIPNLQRRIYEGIISNHVEVNSDNKAMMELQLQFQVTSLSWEMEKEKQRPLKASSYKGYGGKGFL